MNNPTLAAGSAGLLAALLLSLASLGILLNALVFDPTIDVRRSSNKNAISHANAVEITERHFFGLADANPNIDLEHLPETTLKLTLQGAFTATADSEAGAIILDEENIAQVYRRGDPLPGNATLESIHGDRVVLKRLGAYETLYFDDPKETKPGLNTRSATRPSQNHSQSQQSDAASLKRREAIRARIKQLRGK